MLRIDYPFRNKILACGVQSPAGFCLTKKNCGYVINDLGSLDETGAFQHYQHEIERIKEELKIKPKIITHDLQPEYASTKYAKELTRKIKGLRCEPSQHHKAHIASCIGENRIKDKIIGVVFDGAGLGEDGQIWGGEFFIGNLGDLKRIAHLKYTAVPNTAQTEPWQRTASFLYQALGESFVDLEIDFVRSKEKDQWNVFKQNLTNSVYTSSVANLFDCVCLLVGLRDKVDYEGQGVVDLERIINRSSHVAGKIYEFKFERNRNEFLISSEAILQNIIGDLKNNISKAIISATFHNTMIEIVRKACDKIRRSYKLKDVILTGSVFQNKFLFKRLQKVLADDGFEVITHKHFKCNDTNISFGQAVLADAQ